MMPVERRKVESGDAGENGNTALDAGKRDAEGGVRSESGWRKQIPMVPIRGWRPDPEGDGCFGIG